MTQQKWIYRQVKDLLGFKAAGEPINSMKSPHASITHNFQ